jgi:flagellar biosynthesis protein FlhF
MEVKTFRAATMYEALAMVRRELGPDAAVLHTREVENRRLFGWLAGARQIEVTASCDVNVPSRFPQREWSAPACEAKPSAAAPPALPAAPRVANEVHSQLAQLQVMVADLCRRSPPDRDVPEERLPLFSELLDCGLDAEQAREWVGRVRDEASAARAGEEPAAKAQIAKMLEAEIQVTGPIRVTPGGRRLAALVGPTGVGKTTTIAKLAAHYRLREKRRVGLITVDTYRIAAVEQLRTYADIIDLPMQVVSTPSEMRQAVARMDDLELILVDTAGHSPKDEVRIQELRAFLSEAEADEVHLVLGSTAGPRVLERTAERFAVVGATALILTKLDETVGLGGTLPMLRASRLPLSYLTNGQNVPDDIEVAGARRLARLILGMEGLKKEDLRID